MIKKTLFTLGLILLVMILTGIDVNMTIAEDILRTVNVKIEEDRNDNIWRVRDNEGKNMGTIKVKKADRINWQAKGSDMKFTFSKDVNQYFNFDEEMFKDGKSQEITDRQMLSVTLKSDAPADTLIYQVYVVEADTFVVGDSPPKVIIN